MTTSVKIVACCAPDKEVCVRISGATDAYLEEFTIQDGETAERYAFDDREIHIKERIKQ